MVTFSLDKVLFERGPVKVWAINNAHHLIGMLLLGAIPAVWQEGHFGRGMGWRSPLKRG